MSKAKNILGLDLGERRIGIARINTVAQIAEPLAVLQNDDKFVSELKWYIAEHSIDQLVVGMPRNLQGEKTQQSTAVELFTSQNLQNLGLPVVFQDETLSTVMAESRSTLPKSMEDAVAACVILEDYIMENEGRDV